MTLSIVPSRSGAEGAGAPVPSFGVVICAYSPTRWNELVRAVESVTAQSRPAAQVVVVIDHNDVLLARARRAFPHAQVVASEGLPGLSGARNTGLRCVTADVVAFLDDDASADAGWLGAMARQFVDPQVVGVGGWVAPRWESTASGWLAPELYWIVGCSYRGLPDGVAEIRNPIGANMAFRRAPLLELGGFREGVGRIRDRPLGDEETDLAIRARARWPEARILHVPQARVHHVVPAGRTSWRYLVSRSWAEGRSKAQLSQAVGSASALASERTYVTRALPAGVWSGVRDAVRGDPDGIARAVSIIIALAVTVAGYAFGRVRSL